MGFVEQSAKNDCISSSQAPVTVEGKTIFLPTLQGKPIPAREWVVDDWILSNCVTALYGDGGVGKSLLAMQLLTCVSLGKPFIGIETHQMPVFGFFCEDPEVELHRRQVDINYHYGISFEQMQNFHWQSRVGYDNILMDFNSNGVGKATKVYEYLRKEVQRVGAKLVVIDTAADTFGGNENNRSQVRQFINLLGKLALEIGGAVVVCAHPSAYGLANNSGTGGSTAWNNTVRSRIYLSRIIDKKSEDLSQNDARDLRELTKMKSNYSTIGDKFILRYSEGVFIVEEGQAKDIVSQIARKNQNREDDEIFLSFLDQLTEQGRVVSDSKQATSYAPKIMAQMDIGKTIGKGRLIASMERLFASGVIDRGYVMSGTDRKKKDGVRRKPIQNECSEVQHGSL